MISFAAVEKATCPACGSSNCYNSGFTIECGDNPACANFTWRQAEVGMNTARDSADTESRHLE